MQIAETLDSMKHHSFNLIGLADREKFHTGMLAYTLNSLLNEDRSLALELISDLWGKDRISKVDFGIDKLEVLVETKSVDLVVLADGQPILFAEMKLKTTLRKHQVSDYAAKLPGTNGVVLGLFPEETDHNEIPSHKFTQIVPHFMVKHPEFLASKGDEIALIRMWTRYVRLLDKLADWYTSLGRGQVPEKEELGSSLRELKLLGIFELQRYTGVARLLRKCLPEENGFEIILFNSHGNAGLHCIVPDPDKSRYVCGLQWQANLLKLFVEEMPRRRKHKELDKFTLLESLAEVFTNEFGDERKSRKPTKGRFSSITVARWDIHDDIENRSGELGRMLSHVSSHWPSILASGSKKTCPTSA